MFLKKVTGKLGEKERDSCDVPKRKKEEAAFFFFIWKWDSLKALKHWKYYLQWPDCLSVVTHVIWRKAREEEEKITFDPSNIGSRWRENTDTKVSESTQFVLIAPIFYFLSKLYSSPGCTEKSRIPGLLAMSSASFLMCELGFEMNLSQWKETGKETVEICTAQFVYRLRKMDSVNLE